MRTTLQLSVLFSIVLTCLISSGFISRSNVMLANSTEHSESINKTFAPVLAELQKKVNIPVILPKLIPVQESQAIYAVLVEADPERYEIIIGFTEDCTGGNACRIGTISGGVITAAEYQDIGDTIPLNNGIEGGFIPASCGANCSDAIITWTEQNIRYQFGLKAANKERLLQMVNSSGEI